MHLPDHLFNDIESKGSTRNLNTKPNEKLHGPLQNYYKDRTNFKDVAGQVMLAFFSAFLFCLILPNTQILRVDHNFSVACQMRDDLSILNNSYLGFTKNSQDPDAPLDVETDAHVCIGEKQSPCTFDKLPEWVCGHTVFAHF